MAKNGKSTIGPGRPKLIVMPFQPAEGQLSKEIGLGLGIHFFSGQSVLCPQRTSGVLVWMAGEKDFS
jgi:hypothetical protein